MHRECGWVTEIDGTRIRVESAPDAGCASCAARGSCMVGSEQKVKSIWMENRIGASVGDTVVYGVEEKGVVLGALLLYLLPVLLLIAGAFFAPKIPVFRGLDGELASAAGGIAGLVLSFLLIRLLSRLFKKKNYFSPEVLSRAEENDHEVE